MLEFILNTDHLFSGAIVVVCVVQGRVTMSSLNTVLLSLVLLGCLFATSFSLPQEEITKDHNKKADIEAMFEFDDTILYSMILHG